MDATLLLNASFEPIRVISWEKAVTLFFLGKVEVIEEYDREVRSISLTVRVPAVVRLLRYVHLGRKRPPLSRLNLYARDEASCQYCRKPLPYRETSIDHVLPRSHGGITEWRNVVIACHPCNRKKGARTPEAANMHLLKKPVEPDWLPILTIRLERKLPDAWLVFLKTKS